MSSTPFTDYYKHLLRTSGPLAANAWATDPKNAKSLLAENPPPPPPPPEPVDNRQMRREFLSRAAYNAFEREERALAVAHQRDAEQAIYSATSRTIAYPEGQAAAQRISEAHAAAWQAKREALRTRIVGQLEATLKAEKLTDADLATPPAPAVTAPPPDPERARIEALAASAREQLHAANAAAKGTP